MKHCDLRHRSCEILSQLTISHHACGQASVAAWSVNNSERAHMSGFWATCCRYSSHGCPLLLEGADEGFWGGDCGILAAAIMALNAFLPELAEPAALLSTCPGTAVEGLGACSKGGLMGSVGEPEAGPCESWLAEEVAAGGSEGCRTLCEGGSRTWGRFAGGSTAESSSSESTGSTTSPLGESRPEVVAAPAAWDALAAGPW